VDEYKATFPTVPESEIAIRFVHAYDIGTTTLYMRMQICQMQLTSITEYASQIYEILDNGNCLWFNVNAQSITECANTMLVDEQYLQSFKYMPTGTEEVSETLSEDGGFRFVRTITYPWEAEIKQLYSDNGSPDENETQLYFASASYTEGAPGSAAVLWPHGLVMYLAVNYMPLLDNDNYVSIFHYKGADLGTICPPRCNAYYMPPAML
jgi:hypothetical protein